MSTPPIPPVSEFDVKPSPLVDGDFGPDPSAANDSDKPKTTRQKRKLGLGSNKKARSGVRKLTPADREKIVNLYVAGSMALMPFKQKSAMALAQCSEDCADAWMELADENDGVRRAILALIEGGAWGKVFAAHMPLLLTLVPEGAFNIPIFEVPDEPSVGDDN